MIAGVFDKKRPFSYANRSKNNQPLFRELKVGIISKGQTFGDCDASRNRNYLFTLRTITADACVYSINAVEFINHVAACTKMYQLKMHTQF